jgi:uncharacterized protein (TIRG00374 family)
MVREFAGNGKRTAGTVLVTLLKYAISISILVYLFRQASRDESFSSLHEQPKNWLLFGGALAVYLVGVLATYFRFYLLVRALQLPLKLTEAIRLCAVGFLFNFFTLGVVGGDVVKAAFLARRRPDQKTEAVTSVFVDRAIGLYALFLLATLAILVTDLSKLPVRDPASLTAVKTLCRITVGITAAGAAGIALFALPIFGRSSSWSATLVRIPKVGPLIERLSTAVQIYRRRPILMAVAGLLSIANHAALALTVYLVARGLAGQVPSCATHFIVVPLSAAAGTLPLPGGIGAFEYTLDFLYRSLSSTAVAARQGFVVALAFRILTIFTAAVGAVYYLLGRQEIATLVRHARDEKLSSRPTPATEAVKSSSRESEDTGDASCARDGRPEPTAPLRPSTASQASAAPERAA